MKLNLPMDVSEVQIFLDSLPYDYETAEKNYSVSSPIRVLEKRKAMCLDGALLGAYLLKKPPIIVYLLNEKTAHVVLLTKKNNKFGSVAKSRHKDYLGRPPIFNSVKELAKSYEGFNRYGLADISVIYPDWQKFNRKDIDWQKVFPYGLTSLLDL